MHSFFCNVCMARGGPGWGQARRVGVLYVGVFFKFVFFRMIGGGYLSGLGGREERAEAAARERDRMGYTY